MNTNRWMQELNERFPVRKSKGQKEQFRQYVLENARQMGYSAAMEENRVLCRNRNIVVGDVDKAKVLVTAHYDTPATVGLPNMDCIGVGEAMLMLVPKAAREKYPALGETAMQHSGVPVVIGDMEKCNFSSDQKHFKLGVGLCACRKAKHVGWYCSKIHTRHDTTYDEITLQGVADAVEAVIRQVVGKEKE